MAVLFDVVDVLIRQIHAAVKGGVSVDDQNFPMVPVIVVGGEERRHRGEHLALDAQLPQALGIVVGQCGKLAGAVVHHPDVHALFGFPGQNLQNSAPHQPFIHDEVFHENEMLGLLQLPQHLGPLVLPQREVGHSGLVVGRVAPCTADIAGQCRRSGFLLLQPLHDLGGLGDAVSGLGNQPVQAILQRPMADVALGIPEEQCAEYRQQHNHDQPGDFCRGIHAAVQQIQHHSHGKDDRASVDMGKKIRKPPEGAEQQHNMKNQQQQDQPHTAENSVNEALLPLFQKRQPFIQFLFHGISSLSRFLAHAQSIS